MATWEKRPSLEHIFMMKPQVPTLREEILVCPRWGDTVPTPEGPKPRRDMRAVCVAVPPLAMCQSPVPGCGCHCVLNQTQHLPRAPCHIGHINFCPPQHAHSQRRALYGTISRVGLDAQTLIPAYFLRRIRATLGCYWKPEDNLCRYNISLNIFLPTTFPVCCSFYFNYCIPNDLPFSQQDWKILKDPRSNLWAIIWFSFLASLYCSDFCHLGIFFATV